MENIIRGLHHITAIAGNAKRNYDFYTRVLGLRLVKKTVNFDDPGTYHFYFGNETGEPGTILTFFPYERSRQGHNGTGMVTAFSFAVPKGSFPFWTDRLKKAQVNPSEITERFGEQYLSFSDPDGLPLELVVPAGVDRRKPWVTDEVQSAIAITGFHQVELALKNIPATAGILMDVFGYRLLSQENNRYRFITEAIDTAAIVDLLDLPGMSPGNGGAGTYHHVAFRVNDESAQNEIREKILALGLYPTEKIDRDYFYSVYFREPGGVLFELATENPGFMTDEPLNELGAHLQLPRQYEPARAQIEKVLPVI